ncbi:hypothetical protein DFP72DRAFT_1124980 [Ephemerocybe angulata]|uniref:Uncharacterized protein n=1 Tax=Ephemerocybe angulata TaxID=980116 RepID=A0A8H6M3N0_9AGAR|nr:hypothetical protein DFP72DRAFT_1124980 [Tulosesus angulatus]
MFPSTSGSRPTPTPSTSGSRRVAPTPTPAPSERRSSRAVSPVPSESNAEEWKKAFSDLASELAGINVFVDETGNTHEILTKAREEITTQIEEENLRRAIVDKLEDPTWLASPQSQKIAFELNRMILSDSGGAATTTTSDPNFSALDLLSSTISTEDPLFPHLQAAHHLRLELTCLKWTRLARMGRLLVRRLKDTQAVVPYDVKQEMAQLIKHCVTRFRETDVSSLDVDSVTVRFGGGQRGQVDMDAEKFFFTMQAFYSPSRIDPLVPKLDQVAFDRVGDLEFGIFGWPKFTNSST